MISFLTNIFATFFPIFFPSKRFLLIGLDGAGKSTLACNIAGTPVNVVPTIGGPEVITTAVAVITRIDFNGTKLNKQLQYWQYFFVDVSGLVLVVDSTDDAKQMAEVNCGLHRFLADELLHSVPLLIVVNKIDLPGSMSCEHVSQQLQLESIAGRHTSVLRASITAGQGIDEIKAWMKIC
jgi:signal recognition particle receptor subunit beta